MSKVKIQGHASGTGVLTVTAPNTSTDRTITLPDSTGTILDSTSTLDATKLSGALPALDGSSLTGTGSPSIDDNGTATVMDIGSDNNVRFEQGGKTIGCSYSSGEDHSSTLSWSHLNLGNNGENALIAGRNGTGGYFNFYVNNTNNLKGTSGFSNTDGTNCLTLTSDGRGLSQFTAKAWVRFNGSGTPAITDSHNVSSITDHGTGNYSVNFSNSLSQSHWASSVSTNNTSNFWCGSTNEAAAASYYKFQCWDDVRNTNGKYDPTWISAIVFGD